MTPKQTLHRLKALKKPRLNANQIAKTERMANLNLAKFLPDYPADRPTHDPITKQLLSITQAKLRENQKLAELVEKFAKQTTQLTGTAKYMRNKVKRLERDILLLTRENEALKKARDRS